MGINCWERSRKCQSYKNNILMAFFKIETSTLCLEITFALVRNIRLMHDIELFTIWVGLSTICEYPADDVMSFSHQCELQLLNFLGKIEQIRSLLFILPRSKSKFVQKFSNSSWFWYGEWYIQVKNIFHSVREFLLLNECVKCKCHLVWLEECAVFNKCKRHPFLNH